MRLNPDARLPTSNDIHQLKVRLHDIFRDIAIAVNGISTTGTGTPGTGTTINSGTATIDFGATPCDSATIAVTGQTTITSTSKCHAYIQGATTVDSDEEDHIMAGEMMTIVCGKPTNGVGFTIYAFCNDGHMTQGTYKIQWEWI